MQSPDFEIRRPTLVGETAHVCLQRTLATLRNEGINPSVTVEYIPQKEGVLCGIVEARSLLQKVLPETGSEVWALNEGDSISVKEVVLRIKAPYSAIGIYETAISGILASSTSWATAANKCVKAAKGIPVVAMGASEVHPNIAGNLDYAAVVGGCVSCSTVLGARLAGVTPAWNMPHALVLLIGDTVRATQAFDKHMPLEVPRVAVVDTFKDEAEEALNVAKTLRERLRGIRLNTAAGRGGVTIELVKEVRARLDLLGFKHVEITVSGGFTPERITEFVQAGAPVNTFEVGACIAGASLISFDADIHEIDGKPVAKRGKIPGITPNPRLGRVL